MREVKTKVNHPQFADHLVGTRKGPRGASSSHLENGLNNKKKDKDKRKKRSHLRRREMGIS